ncbi:MAG TPA: hypothetical protein DCS93_18665 [Microscillaceae bacterium]|nr:hypothetical protein [Microscillaceae bacterium]
MIVIGILFLLHGLMGMYRRSVSEERALNTYQNKPYKGLPIIFGDTVMGVTLGKIITIAEAIKAYRQGDKKDKEGVVVEGIGQTETPLKAPYSGREVLYYHTQVIHEYEVQEDSGDQVTIRQRVLNEEESQIRFTLSDEFKETLTVDLRGAAQNTITTLDQLRKKAPEGIQPLGDTPVITKGYRYIEKIIPHRANLQIAGEIFEQENTLVLAKPTKEVTPFVVKIKNKVTSEKEKQAEPPKSKKEMLEKAEEIYRKDYWNVGVAEVISGVLMIVLHLIFLDIK